MSSLAGYTLPNGVTTAYTYDELNRLTNMTTSSAGNPGGGPVSSYAYSLGAAGNRTGVNELSGRTIAWGYDNLYRLTSETFASDPGGKNGAISYTYDPVGNRRQIASTLNAIPSSGLLYYDANDRTSTDAYDDNGNTVSSGGVGSTYDFENHLVRWGDVRIVYDADGNRVAETIGGVTTNYLVDTLNLTGYAQVVAELQAGQITRAYTYGLQRLAQAQPIEGAWTWSIYGYDGHGSVRQLLSPTGVVTDTYDYDAFGNLINQTGTTPNIYLYAGEAYDSTLGLYYNRARYLDVRAGRFWGMDEFEPSGSDPTALHRYLYANDDPVNRIDPSGQFSYVDIQGAMATMLTLGSMALLRFQQALQTVYLNLYRVPHIIDKVNTYLTLGQGVLEGAGVVSRLGHNILSADVEYSPGPGPRGIQVGHAAQQNLADNFPGLDHFEDGVGVQIKSTSQMWSALDRSDCRNRESNPHSELRAAKQACPRGDVRPERFRSNSPR